MRSEYLWRGNLSKMESRQLWRLLFRLFLCLLSSLPPTHKELRGSAGCRAEQLGNGFAWEATLCGEKRGGGSEDRWPRPPLLQAGWLFAATADLIPVLLVHILIRSDVQQRQGSVHLVSVKRKRKSSFLMVHSHVQRVGLSHLSWAPNLHTPLWLGRYFLALPILAHTKVVLELYIFMHRFSYSSLGGSLMFYLRGCWSRWLFLHLVLSSWT